MIIVPSNSASLLPPTITGFSPSSLTGGGQVDTNVTVYGTNFTSDATATVNGSARAVTSFTSAGQIAVSFPPLGAGTYTVTVTTGGGTASASYSFTVPEPSVSFIDPAQGTTGTVITIYGFNLSGASVSIDGVGVAASGKNSLVVTCPSFGSDGARTVAVSNAGGTSTASFMYYTPRSPETTTYTSGSGSYTVPAWASSVDVICVGAGASGEGGGIGTARQGGAAGSWGAGTVSVSGGTLSYSVGAGGVQTANSQSNIAGGASSGGGVSGAGGSGKSGSSSGASPGNFTYNGVTYTGGQGLTGNSIAPGAGGGRGATTALASWGYAGTAGQVWFVARQ